MGHIMAIIQLIMAGKGGITMGDPITGVITTIIDGTTAITEGIIADVINS